MAEKEVHQVLAGSTPVYEIVADDLEVELRYAEADSGIKIGLSAIPLFIDILNKIYNSKSATR